MRKGILVTGTDTDVGKTYIAAAIAGALRREGVDVGVFKPMLSGTKRESPKSDTMILKAFAGSSQPLEEITPFVFQEPLAPLLASTRMGISIKLIDIFMRWQAMNDKHSFYIVEGAGGISVPLGEEYNVKDLALKLGLPLLIVARPGLGTVNHTVLTVDYARRAGLNVLGVVLTGGKEHEAGVAEKTNPHLIETCANVPVLGVIPWLDSDDQEEIITTVQNKINLSNVKG
ncbi:dethiobiotin synthase [Alteribacillus sp. HJP-4]|uniref:dethiobiotin synthase n=1 Tax=Alteribacillus sp. HJP-4 TaxID=2775394 RepID=UPI0035CD0EDF